MNKTIDFLGIKVNALTKDELVRKILEFSVIGRHKMITYLNAHCLNIAFKDEEYKRILNLSDVVYADGIGVVLVSKFLGNPLPERVNIFDFFDLLFREITNRKLGLYFLGAKEITVRKAVDNLKKKFSSIMVLGFHHGYFQDIEEREIIDEINNLKPNILIIGMGVPKQEKWAYYHLNKLEVSLCWMAGGMFENLSGALKNPPKWISHIGFQWLYRLFQEPKRLWRRYLIGNFIFVYRILKWRLQSHLSKDHSDSLHN